MSPKKRKSIDRANQSLLEDMPLLAFADQETEMASMATDTDSMDTTEDATRETTRKTTGTLGRLHPTLIRASAGSGKTYQLTARLLRILLMGAPPESILATTFTRKAAGEIMERVLTDLASAADPENPSALKELRGKVDLPGYNATRASAYWID